MMLAVAEQSTSPVRILVVGDLILDEYLRGAVRRISPEAPVPVMESRGSDLACGGAANVAANIAALGCEVLLCGVVGDDREGRELVRLLRSKSIHTDGVFTDSRRPTTHKVRVVAQGQHVLRIDREITDPLDPEVLRVARDHVRDTISTVDGVICSDYEKGVCADGLMSTVIDAAKAAGKRVLVDPKTASYNRYLGASVLTPNLHELRAATGMPVHGERDLEAAAKRVFESTEAEALLVTCGKSGMVLFERRGGPTRIRAEAREVYDVTGAGDTVIAVLGVELFAGRGMAEAAKAANCAAGIVVGKLGTATVTRQELQHAIEGAARGCRSKILPGAAVVEHLEQERVRGRAIVFTNGCFDLLHAGHIRYLQSARSLGDLLVVGINTDASVRSLKGEARPVVAEKERAEILAALESVDYVVLFDEATPEKLIEHIRPDVLVKGGDYEVSDVVGGNVVQGYGGRVEIVPYTAEHSTSNIIKSVVRRHGTAANS